MPCGPWSSWQNPPPDVDAPEAALRTRGLALTEQPATWSDF